MAGRWQLEDGLFEDFLAGMFPNLEEMVVVNWVGITAGEFTDYLRKSPNHKVKKMKLNLEEAATVWRELDGL
ncbi:hypothetical protein BGX29_010419, partial [Mortierella sp. GBA35]